MVEEGWKVVKPVLKRDVVLAGIDKDNAMASPRTAKYYSAQAIVPTSLPRPNTDIMHYLHLPLVNGSPLLLIFGVGDRYCVGR